MNEKLTKELFEKFPELYAGHKLSPQENLMCFGFECGDGWHKIIYALSQAINDNYKNELGNWEWDRDNFKRKYKIRNSWYEIKRHLKELFRYIFWNKNKIIKYSKPSGVMADQVKEKYGSLRYYTNHGNDYVYGLISMAEYMSYLTCEKCGTTKNVTQNKTGWISSLCPKCRKNKD